MKHMMNTTMENPVRSRFGRFLPAAIALLAAAYGFSGLAGYFHPGEPARLLAFAAGVDTGDYVVNPLLSALLRLTGPVNWLAPLFGALAAALVGWLTAFYLSVRMGAELPDAVRRRAPLVAGAVAGAVFVFTPCVHDTATHLDAQLFDCAWALVALAPLAAYAQSSSRAAWLWCALAGALHGAAATEAADFVILLPVALGFAWAAARRRGGRGYLGAALHLTFFALFAVAVALPAVGDFGAFAEAQKDWWRQYGAVDRWYFPLLFAFAPFAVAVFAMRRLFGGKHSLTGWTYALLQTVVAIVAVATPWSPSSVFAATPFACTLAAAAVAADCGWLCAYWWSQTRVGAPSGESRGEADRARLARPLGCAAGGLLALVLAASAFIESFFRFDSNRGAFMDAMARRVLDGLGERDWFVTDGTLDDHLRLEARARGRSLRLVCLQREGDERAIERLAREAEDDPAVGPRAAAKLRDFGILPFLQEWFGSSPQVARERAAIWGAPDLWLYAGGAEAVAETLYFGADPERAGSLDGWTEALEALGATEEWGSYRAFRDLTDPVERLRLLLRLHLGLTANNRGYSYFREALDAAGRGDAARRDELFGKAWEMFELTLGRIDSDNVSALFNEFELVSRGYAKAAAKAKEIQARLKRMADDPARRYPIGRINLLYGYICNPQHIYRLGLAQLQQGRPLDGLGQIRRAIELVPLENRSRMELLLLAPLYASGFEKEKARRIYAGALEKDANDRTALLGMARLAMMEGDRDKAIGLMEKALAEAGDDPAVRIEAATLCLMQNRTGEAKDLLRRITDADKTNLRAWSLLAAVVMRQIDALAARRDDPEAARERERLEKELEQDILAVMEGQSRGPGDYYVESTRAFVAMHKGGRDNLAMARDRLVQVAKSNPGVAATGDMILSLDIQLDDKADAERQAVQTLSVNPQAPLANYVMGSIQLGRDNLDEAERHLRTAVAAPTPQPLALNDLAECLRRRKAYADAEKYARAAIAAADRLYVAWETLGAVLMDADGDLDEAERCVRRACELSKDESGREVDVRMLVSLARVQLRRNDLAAAKKTLRSALLRVNELSEFERREFEELRRRAK